MTGIELQKPDLQEFAITIVGDSPLIMHRWSDKAKKMILDKQMKKASKGREARDPEKDYEESIYYREDRSYGFPAIGIKSAMVRAGKNMGIPMTDSRTAFHIPEEMVCIQGTPRPREDMVRIDGGRTADIRYRAEFPDWKSSFRIVFNAAVLSAEQIVNMLEFAGFGVGIGEWRPEKNGQFGRFHVEVK